MKKLLAATLLAATGLFAPQAHAQSAVRPDYDAPARKGSDAGTRKSRKASGEDIARMQQRMSMNPDAVKRDQQMEVLEARAGTSNTSFGRASGPARQFEKGSGGFTVRRFRDKRGTAQQKRGQSRPSAGIDPKGKPLTHKKHRFLLF